MTQKEGFELPEFKDPVELQEWYDIGADIRVAIRKQFSELKKQSQERIQSLIETIAERESMIQFHLDTVKKRDAEIAMLSSILRSIESSSCDSWTIETCRKALSQEGGK